MLSWWGGGGAKILSLLKTCQYSSAPLSAGNTFQDLQCSRETADDTERYI
jgi:hypothetical protein